MRYLKTGLFKGVNDKIKHENKSVLNDHIINMEYEGYLMKVRSLYYVVVGTGRYVFNELQGGAAISANSLCFDEDDQ